MERSTKGGATAGVLLFACVGVLALPSAVLAFGARFQPKVEGSATIDSIDHGGQKLAASTGFSVFSNARGFPFTPAGTPDRQTRSVMVAVRVDPKASQVIIVHGKAPNVGAESDMPAARLRIAQSGFNLGVARGYQDFSQGVLQAQTTSTPELPNMDNYSLKPGTKANESRFSPRISIDDKKAPGRSPRTFVGEQGEVDLGGAYRVTENLDVTAGVRYSQERERLSPLNNGKQDSQAVYVGTQFRF